MINHDFITLPVSDSTDMDVYLAIPDGNDVHPAIIVLQEAFGVNAHIRDISERLCRQRYVVIAPDLFHRTERRVELGYDDFTKVRPYIQQTSREGFTADLQCCYDYLEGRPFVVKNKIGSIGFCMGGRVSFIANLTLPLAAAVSYYGSGIDQLSAEAQSLHAPHLFFWGGIDKHISHASIDKAMGDLKAAHKDYTNVVISYADHGFNCDARASYNPKAAQQAWAHTLAFFEMNLKK
jgi:carboxymethylenebutenolidase